MAKPELADLQSQLEVELASAHSLAATLLGGGVSIDANSSTSSGKDDILPSRPARLGLGASPQNADRGNAATSLSMEERRLRGRLLGSRLPNAQKRKLGEFDEPQMAQTPSKKHAKSSKNSALTPLVDDDGESKARQVNTAKDAAKSVSAKPEKKGQSSSAFDRFLGADTPSLAASDAGNKQKRKKKKKNRKRKEKE
ncbi:hypothetical protein RI367_008361 [Sorochytrium milnesiophthora]